MPPPAEASTRISATSSCIFCCIFCACCILACMLPGIFMALTLLQISHRADLAVRKHFLESPHLRMRESAAGDFVFLGRGRCHGRLRGFAVLDRDLDGSACHSAYGRFEFL